MGTLEQLVYEEGDLPCRLCGGDGHVEVIPKGWGGQEAQLDECPWCLRRELSAPPRWPWESAALEAEAKPLRAQLAQRAATWLGRAPTVGEVQHQTSDDADAQAWIAFEDEHLIFEQCVLTVEDGRIIIDMGTHDRGIAEVVDCVFLAHDGQPCPPGGWVKDPIYAEGGVYDTIENDLLTSLGFAADTLDDVMLQLEDMRADLAQIEGLKAEIADVRKERDAIKATVDAMTPTLPLRRPGTPGSVPGDAP